MNQAIYFKTAKFDVSKETQNPINPIYDHSLLDWLRAELKEEIVISEPDAEDWGWYSNLEFNGRNYLIGASAFFEEGDDPNEELEWVFQVTKHRFFKEKLLGRNKMNANDECFIFFKSFLEKQTDMKEVCVA